MGSARTESTKQRRERKRAKKDSERIAKRLLRQAALATHTLSQTNYGPTSLSFQPVPLSPMATGTGSGAQSWIQAGNPNLEPLGNRRGGHYSRVKPTGVVKPDRQQIKERHHQTHTPTEESILGERGYGREAGTPNGLPLGPESNNNSGKHVLDADTELSSLSSLYGSVSLTPTMGPARTIPAIVGNISSRRWADSPAGPEGGVMLYADGDRWPSSPARLIRPEPQAIGTSERPAVPNRRSTRSDDAKRNASLVGNEASGPPARPSPVPAPRPTEAYLLQTSQPPKKLNRPRNILLILDLNGTLLYRKNRSKSHNIVTRPHTGEFLQYLLSNFSVMIWSSATPASVAAMCGKLFSTEQRRLLVAEWGRDKLGLTPEQYSQKVQVYKQLESVWDSDVAASHPEYSTGGRWDQSNTVLLDDSALKASAQPYNHISVPEFTGGREPEDRTSTFNQVMRYLEEITLQQDVSSYIRRVPFSVTSPGMIRLI